MVSYNADFLKKVNLLSNEQITYLDNLVQDIDTQNFLKDIPNDKSLVAKLCFDFIYTSAVIEGNTYTRGEAQTLFETKRPISSKSIDDANMLLNIKESLEYIITQQPPINKHTIRELHQILSQGLLTKQAQGGVRKIAVTIGNSDYIPLNNPQELEIQMDSILATYQTISNPFNKAIYIHNNIAYLQYFEDCNKRLARTLQNLSLMLDNKPFLSYNAARAETEIKAQYKDSLLAYYEKGDTLPYSQFFTSEYTKTLQTIKEIQKIQIQSQNLANSNHTQPKPKPRKR